MREGQTVRVGIYMESEVYLSENLTHQFLGVFFQAFNKNNQNYNEGSHLAQKNKARFGLKRVKYHFVDYLLDKICKFLKLSISELSP